MTPDTDSREFIQGARLESGLRGRITQVLIVAVLTVLVFCSVPAPPLNGPTSVAVVDAAEPETLCFLPYLAKPLDPSTLAGLLFFDMNGSGLRENGEPGIAEFTVCVTPPGQDQTCVQTDQHGQFRFSPAFSANADQRLFFKDPHHDVPGRAFRFINVWLGTATIEAYEMNGVQVPEQDLNDTVIMPLESGVDVATGKQNDIGLMQGFLTLPYRSEDASVYRQSNYCDLDIQVESVRVFNEIESTGDQHYGIDYDGPYGAFVVNAAPGVVFYVRGDAAFVKHELGGSTDIESMSGHMSATLVEVGQRAYRGQIIGTNGDFMSEGFPHIHFGVYYDKVRRNGRPAALDPYRDLKESILRFEEYVQRPDGYPPQGQMISIGSPGYWTVDNEPQFP